jgi:hypothetical protein
MDPCFIMISARCLLYPRFFLYLSDQTRISTIQPKVLVFERCMQIPIPFQPAKTKSASERYLSKLPWRNDPAASILLTRSYKPWCTTLILSNATHHLEMGILFRNLGETLGGPVYEYDIKRCASTKNFFLQLYSKSGCILGTEIRTRTPIDSNHS